MAKIKSPVYSKLLSMGETLGEAWNIFTRRFDLIIAIIFLFSLPGFVFSLLLTFVSVPEWLQILLLFIFSFLPLIVHLSIMSLAKSEIDGNEISFGEALRRAFPAFWHILIFGFLMGVIIFIFIAVLSLVPIFLVLFFFPLVYFGIQWQFYVQAILFKKARLFDSLLCSRALVKGRWWQVFGRSLVYGLIGAGASLSFVLFFSIFSSITHSNFETVFSVFIPIFSLLVGAFFVLLQTVFFLNFDADVCRLNWSEKQSNENSF